MSDVSVWNKSNLQGKGEFRYHPSESVLRAVLSPNYFNNFVALESQAKILDIGCLYCNNLVPFADRGHKLFGTEVTDESVDIARTHAELNQIEVEVKKGFNTQLPYQNDWFDLVLSIATIHYEEKWTDVADAFSEFHRVLKPGGRAVIRTVAPLHSIFAKSEKQKDGTFILNLSSDLRHGQRFCFFENQELFIDMLSETFSDVECARINESYPRGTLDFFMAVCTKSA